MPRASNHRSGAIPPLSPRATRAKCSVGDKLMLAARRGSVRQAAAAATQPYQAVWAAGELLVELWPSPPSEQACDGGGGGTFVGCLEVIAPLVGISPFLWLRCAIVSGPRR